MPDHIGLTSSIQTARQVGTKRKQGKVYGAITKDEQIEIDGLSYPINSAKSGCHVEWLQRAIRHAVAVEQVYKRALIVRFDLRNPPPGGDNKAIRAFMDKASKAIRGKYDHKPGYMWAREQETAKGHHYHVALLLDGDRVMAGQPVFELVEPIWRNMGGSLAKAKTKKGAENLPYFMMIGRGAAPLTDATYWLSYLTKPRGKGYRGDYAQDFGTAQLSSQAKPRKKGAVMRPARPMNQGAINLRRAARTKTGLSTEQLDDLGLRPVVAGAWGKIGGVKRVARHFGFSPAGVAKFVKTYRPGELEAAYRLVLARQEATRKKGLELIRAGMGQVEAAQAVGASRSAGHYWVKRDPELGKAKQEAEADWAKRRAMAADMLRAGVAGKAVTEATGLSAAMLSKVRRELGIPKQSAGITDEQIEELSRLVDAGTSVRGAAKALGVPHSLARRRLDACQ